MPTETAAPAPATQAEPKQTTQNIVKSVTDRATGKSPAQEQPQDDKHVDKRNPVAQVPDPNAGKKKYTVEGKDVWLTPEQADAYVQKGIAFEPRVSELDRLKREVSQFEQTLVNNPGLILANIAKVKNIPMQTLVENVLNSNVSDEVKEATGKWYWENVVKRHQMDPKDLQILEQEERIKALEMQDKQKAEEAIAAENRVRVVKALGEISAQIQETLGELGLKNVDSPAAIRITKEIADVMRLSYLKREPCTAKQAAEKVKARILEYQRQFYDSLDAEQLVEAIGKENAEKVRKHLLKAVQDAGKGTQQENRRNAEPPKRDVRKTINMDDFHDYLDELKKSSK